jgi:putative phosphoserine phosphatase/1-acylglycerol-3-phosphate O-acyltransferase
VSDENPFITRHIDALPNGAQIGAFFDFDGTVIDGFSSFTFLKEQLLKGYISPAQFVDLVAGFVNYSSGLIGFASLMEIGPRILKGVDESSYIDFSNRICAKQITPTIYPEAKALINAHKAKGHTVAIISSAPVYQIKPLLEELGVEHLICSHYETRDGKFTGKLLKPVCWGHGKVTAVKNLAKQQSLDLTNSCFYSDSDDDLEALEAVGFPRVVNPNQKLESIAKQRNWPSQFFARLGKPSALEYIRSVGVYGSLLGSYFAGLGMNKLIGSKEDSRRFMLGLFTDLAFAMIRVKLNVKGREHLWENPPYVVVFNHQSQADGLVMMRLLRDNFAAIGKKELGRFKLFAKAYNFAGIIPIDRENTQSAIEAMQPLVNALKVEKRNVVIAPEGTRSPTRKPLGFKKGAFHVAMQAGVPVLPVVIHNAIDIQPKGQFAYRPGTIEVEVLPPIDTSGWNKGNLDERIAEVRNLFLETLGFEPEPFPAKKPTYKKPVTARTRNRKTSPQGKKE